MRQQRRRRVAYFRFRHAWSALTLAGLCLVWCAQGRAKDLWLDEENQISLKVGVFTQVRYSYRPTAQPGAKSFDIPLARLSFSGTAFDPRVHYFFQAEGSTLGDTNRLRLLDAWAGFQPSTRFAVQGGRFLLPFSRQFLTHPGNLLFADLSIADYAFNLPRSLGVGASGGVSRLQWSAAVVNSVRALDATGQRNLGGTPAVVGRLEWNVIGSYGYLESGYLESAPDRNHRPGLSIGFAAARNPVAEASAFQNVMPGDRTSNFTIDAGYRRGRLTVQAAGYIRRNQLAARSLGRADAWGSYAQVGYYVAPGRWEVAARAANVDFGRPNNPMVFGDAAEYTVGLNRYLRQHNLKVQADYSFTSERGAARTRTDNRLRLQFQILL